MVQEEKTLGRTRTDWAVLERGLEGHQKAGRTRTIGNPKDFRVHMDPFRVHMEAEGRPNGEAPKKEAFGPSWALSVKIIIADTFWTCL